jgi:hypothetical protein
MKKRVMAVIAALMLLVTMGAQFAPVAQAEGEPLTEATPTDMTQGGETAEPVTGETASPTDAQTTDDPEPAVTDEIQADGQDEPQEDASPVEVSNYDEFSAAVLNAQDGDIIMVTGVIEVPLSVNWGSTGKHITLRRGSPTAFFMFPYDDSDAPETVFAGFTFDGAGITASVSYLEISSNTRFENVKFTACGVIASGGAVNVNNNTAHFVNCLFDENHAQQGGHLSLNSSGSTVIENCTFINGKAEYRGGAIIIGTTTNSCSITGSLITNNEAGMIGGGILTEGITTIEATRIYNNVAVEGGSDLASGYWGHLNLVDSLETLTSMFEETGLVPVGWVFDYPTTPITIPGEVRNVEHALLKLAFVDDTPPTEPEKIIETVYVTVPEYIYRTEYVYITEPAPDTPSTPTPAPTPSEPSEPTVSPTPTPEPTQAPATPRLVCGDAVIDATRRDYLIGYADSHAGQGTPLKRSQAVQIIYRLLTADSLERVYSETGGFLDVSKDDWCDTFASTLKNARVIVGCGGDMFKPEKNLTRGEMVTLFTRFVAPRTDQDIDLDHWSADAVRTAASLKWITYDGDFDPDEEVSVQEFIDFALDVIQWANS